MVKYSIVLPDLTEITSGTDAVNAIASTTLTAAANSGTDLTLGSVCAAALECTLITPGAGLNIRTGDEITLYRTNDSGKKSPAGVFYVEKPTHPTANRTKIIAYDRISKLDKDLSEWLATYNDYPITLGGFANLVCFQCGLSLDNANFPNSSFMVTEKPTSAPVTGRQLMQWVAEIAGRFLIANEEGKLEFGWYENSGITVSPSGDNYYYSGSLSYEGYTTAAVDAVKVRLTENEDDVLWPVTAATNPYIIENNRLLAMHGTAIEQSVFDNMLTAAALQYAPCKVSVPVATGIRVGQVITVVDTNGVSLNVPVMEAVYSGQKITITATGAATRSSAENLNNQNLKDYADHVAENAVASQTQEDVFNKLTNNGKAEGVYIENGKLYINASYIKTGELNADLIKTGKIQLANQDGSRFVLDLDNGQFYIEGFSKIKLLWENASKTSAFPAQTLNLNLQNYDAYIIIARHATGVAGSVSGINKTGYSIRLTSIGSGSAESDENIRTATYSSGSISFGDAKHNGAVNNGVIIPIFIYGVRGVEN